MAAKDWDKVFEDYKGCKFATIKEYIDAEAPEYKDYVKEQINGKVSYLRIKKEFYEKYFPKYVPEKSKATMKKLAKDW